MYGMYFDKRKVKAIHTVCGNLQKVRSVSKGSWIQGGCDIRLRGARSAYEGMVEVERLPGWTLTS